MEDFLLEEIISEGTYGVVYKVKNKKTAQFVALKKLTYGDTGIPSTAVREISLLKELSHPNIVRLEKVFFENSDICLVFELLDMDLKTYMDCLGPRKYLEPTIVKSYLYQINSAILYCHNFNVIHRNLKPQNLLIDRTGIIKVADFGLSRGFCMFLKAYASDVAKLWYKAPELLVGSKMYTCAIDIWAMGCIFAEMISKKTLFQGDSGIDQICSMIRMLGTPSEKIWPGVSNLSEYKTTTFPSCPSTSLRDQGQNVNDDGIDLLRRMLWYDPRKRISAMQVSLHPYFRDVKLPLGLARSGENSAM